MDWLDFYDGAISAEQLKVGLAVAGTAVAVAVVALVTLLMPHGAPVHWAEAGCGLAAVAAAGVYIAVQYRTAEHRRTMALRPTTVLVMVLASVAGISLLNVAGDGGGPLYLPLFTEVPVFVAMIGNPTMRGISLGATVAAMAATVAVVAPAAGPAPWAQILVAATVLVVLDRMVALVMTSVRGRNRARGGVNQLMSLAAEAEDLDEGLAACLPWVDTILPAHAAAVLLRRADAGAPQLVAAWVADAVPGGPAAAAAWWELQLHQTGEDRTLAAALAATSTVISGRWCAMPIGWGPDGELMLVVDRRMSHGYAARFTQEAADALAACFLRLTGRLAHLDRLRQASLTDPLTGLANRRQLRDRLDVELARSRRTGAPVTVAMVDLDRFKQFNDTFGHLPGDQLLRTVAAAVTSRLRSQDLAARYGGDELCLVMPDTDAAGAAALLDDVRRHVATATGVLTSGARITVSAGAAVSDGQETADEVLVRADAQLFEAKDAGRDSTRVTTDPACPTPPTAS